MSKLKDFLDALLKPRKRRIQITVRIEDYWSADKTSYSANLIRGGRRIGGVFTVDALAGCFKHEHAAYISAAGLPPEDCAWINLIDLYVQGQGYSRLLMKSAIVFWAAQGKTHLVGRTSGDARNYWPTAWAATYIRGEPCRSDKDFFVISIVKAWECLDSSKAYRALLENKEIWIEPNRRPRGL